MRSPLLVALLLSLSPPLYAQRESSHPWSAEIAFGPAQTLEGFASDCCGSTRTTSGTSLSVRLMRRIHRSAEVGLDGGATLVPGRDMRWLMAVGSLTASSRIAPWIRLGAGLVGHRGECPADGSSTLSICDLDLVLGGQLAAGARWSMASRVAVGLEAELVRGTTVRERHFTTRRITATLRWLWG